MNLNGFCTIWRACRNQFLHFNVAVYDRDERDRFHNAECLQQVVFVKALTQMNLPLGFISCDF